MSARDGYGQRRVEVTPDAIEAWLVHEERIITNLPEDARFLRMYPDDTGMCYHFIFESGEWEEVEEGLEIPQHDVEVEHANTEVLIKK